MYVFADIWKLSLGDKMGDGTQNRKGKKEDITKRLKSPIEPSKRNINSGVILGPALQRPSNSLSLSVEALLYFSSRSSYFCTVNHG